MEYISEILTSTAPYVHFISFALLILSGMNIPISEDIVIIVSASIAATLVPENRHYIFIGCFAGAYISDIIAYSIGRFAAPKILYSDRLSNIRLFNRRNTEKKINKIKKYFAKYGGKTLFFGRFIPFGFRNILFMTSGLVRMKFTKFILIDFIALTSTSTILYLLGYSFGNKYKQIFPYLNRYKFIILGIFLAIIIVRFIRRRLIKPVTD